MPTHSKNYIYSSKHITFSGNRASTLLKDSRLVLRVSRVFPLPDWARDEVVKYFLRYLDVTNASVIVIKDENGLCYLPYRHRFRNVNDVLRKFEEIFNRASKQYRYGVWLTITTNPIKYEDKDYLTYRYEIMKALNRFLSWLRRKFGKVSYINAIEFTDSGLIHFHVVVFGLKRIEDSHLFMRRLRKWGFGYVHYMVSIVNDGTGWRPKVLSRYCENCDGGAIPKDVIIASRIGLKNYLKKYLMKTLRSIEVLNSIFNDSTLDSNLGVFQTSLLNRPLQNGLGLSMNGVLGPTSSISSSLWKLAFYWALRLRFFTYSRDLMRSSNKIRLGRYRFAGVFLIERYIEVDGYWHDWLSYPEPLCSDIVSITELMF